MRDDHAFGGWFFSDIKEWINANTSPEEVYDEEKLCEWARDNGFVKEDTE